MKKKPWKFCEREKTGENARWQKWPILNIETPIFKLEGLCPLDPQASGRD